MIDWNEVILEFAKRAGHDISRVEVDVNSMTARDIRVTAINKLNTNSNLPDGWVRLVAGNTHSLYTLNSLQARYPLATSQTTSSTPQVSGGIDWDNMVATIVRTNPTMVPPFTLKLQVNPYDINDPRLPRGIKMNLDHALPLGEIEWYIYDSAAKITFGGTTLDHIAKVYPLTPIINRQGSSQPRASFKFDMDTAKMGIDPSHNHSWQRYNGFMWQFDFCTICDEQKEIG